MTSRPPLLLRDSALECLPDGLYAAVVTGPGHNLDERIAGVSELRSALLSGTVPSPHALTWPPSPIKECITAYLRESGLHRYCRDQPDLTDAVTLSIIEESTTAGHRTARKTEEIFRELVEIEVKRRNPPDSPVPRGRSRTPQLLSAGEMAKLREMAEQRAQAMSGDAAASALAAQWGERIRAWAAVEEVFGELGIMCGLGWDLSCSVLQHVGWGDAQRLADLLKRLPQIQDVVRRLGRMQSTDRPDEAPILERLLGPVSRVQVSPRDIETPPVPHDTRGVERSGDIARMLPSEAVLFIRPTLRLLWHARRTERALATYHVRGVEREHLIADDAGNEARDAERKRNQQERGPIIVCLDTSGSMQGAPETIAKAVTLEAVRIANAEKRDCFLYAWSGPGQIAELDLSIGRGGIPALLHFLGFSFYGGNELAEPVNRMLNRARDERWSRADIIMVSDGEWPVPRQTAAAVDEARTNTGLRVHGLLIGAAASAAMSALCDPLHVFKDWNALEGGRVG